MKVREKEEGMLPKISSVTYQLAGKIRRREQALLPFFPAWVLSSLCFVRNLTSDPKYSLKTREAAMANPSMKTLISVMIALFFVSETFASSDAPFIVAHKKVTLNRVKSGAERISVSIDLYNQGSATAYDVSLVDDSWTPDIFNLVGGSSSKTWERIDAGSVVTHSFALESNVKTVFYGAPAVIKFRVPTKAALQEAYSTPMPPLEILADRPPEKKFEWAKKLLTKYGSLVSVISIVALFVYVVATPSKSSAAKGNKKRR